MAKKWPAAGRPPRTPGASRPPLRAGKLTGGKATDLAAEAYPDTNKTGGDAPEPQGGKGS
jgi:hypothetical protein